MTYVPPWYPSSIPGTSQLPDREDDVDWLYAARYNELKKEMIAIMTELGVLPKGSYASVKARLDAGGSKISDADEDTQADVEQSADEDKFRVKTAGTERLLLDENGILTLAHQSAAGVYLSASISNITKDTWTKVTFDSEEYDIKSEFDPVTNNRFTATKDGIYLIVLTTMWDDINANKQYQARITKNGSTLRTNRIANGGLSIATPGFSTVTAINLSANDYIDFYVASNSVDNNADLIGGSFGSSNAIILKIT